MGRAAVGPDSEIPATYNRGLSGSRCPFAVAVPGFVVSARSFRIHLVWAYGMQWTSIASAVANIRPKSRLNASNGATHTFGALCRYRRSQARAVAFLPK